MPTTKRHKLYLDGLNSQMYTHQGQSTSGAHTLCNVIWIQCRDFTPAAVGTCRVGWVLEATLFFFSFPSYLFSCTHVTFGRMLLMLRINPEALGRGRNLDRTSSQDSTRCESCLATEHEILSAGRWFIILLLQLGGNGMIETLRKGNGYRFIFPPPMCQQIPEHFSEFDYFFCLLLHWHDNVEECRNENIGDRSKSGWKFGAMVHADAVICMSVQNQSPVHFRDIHTIWQYSHSTAQLQPTVGGPKICFSGLGKTRTRLSEFDQFLNQYGTLAVRKVGAKFHCEMLLTVQY